MPEAAERAMRAKAKSLAAQGKLNKKADETTAQAIDRYVYGGMRSKLNWKPSTQKGGRGKSW